MAGLVFGKRKALLHHYVPDFLPHRWEELERLKGWFKPISQKSEYEVHVYGPMGTGKTVLCNRLGRYLMDKVKRRGVNLNFVNINLAYTPKPPLCHVITYGGGSWKSGPWIRPRGDVINIVEKIWRALGSF